MWKQIFPADHIFIHGEDSSWKILPHTDTSYDRPGPTQVLSFKKAAASELPTFSQVLQCKSQPLAYTWHLTKTAGARPRWKWSGRQGGAVECGGKGYGEGTER